MNRNKSASPLRPDTEPAPPISLSGERPAGASPTAPAARQTTFEELLSQLERRLELLRAISASLVRSREAILRLDSDDMLKTAAEQQSLCTELRQLQASLIANSGGPLSQTPTAVTLRLAPAELQRAGALRRELADAEREVRNAARLNAAVLRRSGRTAASLRNLYLSFVGTYTNPNSLGSADNTQP